MSKLSQTDQIFQILKQHPYQPFKVKEIAQGIIDAHPSIYQAKRLNPRFESDKDRAYAPALSALKKRGSVVKSFSTGTSNI